MEPRVDRSDLNAAARVDELSYTSKLMQWRTRALVLVVAVGALALYTVGLAYSPPYLHEAEVLFGLHAHAIATSGHDVYGRFLPLYFQMTPLGENTWWHPALVYFTALWLQIAPLGEASLRAPSALVGTIDVLLVYLIARRLFESRQLALLAAALLAITPSHFIQSRIAMDYIYPLPFVLGWTLCLLRFLEDRRPITLFIATSLLGVGTYSYIASVIMMPIYAIVTGGVLIAIRCRDWRLWSAAAAGFSWPLLLIPAWLWFHPGVINQTLQRYVAPASSPVSDTTIGMTLTQALEELRKPEHFTSLPRRLSLYWYFFDPGYLFVTGGYASVMNSTRRVGVFVLPFLALVPLGLWSIAARPQVRSVLVALGFLTAPIAAVLAVPEPYAVDREMAVVPFGVLLATYGIRHLQAGSYRRVLQALVIAVPLHFGFFLYDYFVDYRPRAGFWFGLNKLGAVEAVLRESETHPVKAIYLSTKHDPFLEAYWDFALAKWGRQDLRSKTVVMQVDDVDALIAAAPDESFIVLNRNDAGTERFVSGYRQRIQGGLIRDVPEIGDVQQYWAFWKKCCER